MELSNIGTKTVVAIVGPTAIGKTDLAIEVARFLNTEIISADSRQFYRELTIGTAKPSKEQLTKVKHHFINSHSIHDVYSAGKFEKDALELIDEFFLSNSRIVLVGGSGMYVDAVLKGFNEMPEVPAETRQYFKDKLSKEGLSSLVEELKSADPEYYNQVDKFNHQRVARALEVIKFTGKKFSSYYGKKAKRPFGIIKIGLWDEREILYHRINVRMERMIQEGLFEEATSLYDHRDHYALQTVGYSEIFKFMGGEYDKDEAIRLLKRNSRRYAKRQFTWFKKDSEIHWFKPHEKKEIIRLLEVRMSQ